MLGELRARFIFRFACNTVLLAVLVAWTAQRGTAQDRRGHPAEARNMELVGMNDLQGRPAYQPVIHRQGNRFIAYVGLHAGTALNPLNGRTEGNGTMIVDVTDPRRPQALAHIPGFHDAPERQSQAQMARVCDIAGGTYLLRAAGTTRHDLWNVTDPTRPQFVTVIVDGLKNNHKNWWECDTGVAYLPSFDPAWRTRITKIYDLSNPSQPRFIRDFALPGQEGGATVEPVPPEPHGPISHNGRVYFAYGTSRNGIVQIVDREKLLRGDPAPTPQNFLSPQIGRLDMPPDWGGHTAYPMLNVPIPDWQGQSTGKVRDILAVASETVRNECEGPRHPLFIFDITNPATPFPISNFQIADSRDFCERGGRFGVHSVQESFSPIYHKKMLFVAYFNAGVRAVDIRDPFRPVEVGYFIPATTERTQPFCAGEGAQRNCKTAIQTNNAEVDERGYIYTSDRRGTGLHILQLSGEARAIADAP